jgi:hypothetical protein
MTDLYVPLLVEIQFRYIIMKHKIVFHWYNMTASVQYQTDIFTSLYLLIPTTPLF